MNIQRPAQPSLVGRVRRFGPQGVLYEVLEILDDGRARIRVLDTGEETSYSLDKIIADPVD
jgi:hypothetical protein